MEGMAGYKRREREELGIREVKEKRIGRVGEGKREE